MFDEALLNHTLLTLEEEIALAHRIQAGDENALDELVRHNLRLVHKIAHRYYTSDPATTYDDLMQEGLRGLLRAAQKYDPQRGFRFSTYATHWVRQYVRRSALTAGTIPRSANPDHPRRTPSAIRGHALRQAPIARLDAPLAGRKGDESLNTLADIVADESISVEDQVLSSIETERIFAALRLNERGQAIVRDWLSGLPRHEVQERHGVSRSWLYSMLTSKKERVMPTTPPATCIEPGCDQPRHVSANGTVLSRCHEHQKQYWNEAARAKTAAARNYALPPSPVPPIRKTEPERERIPPPAAQPIVQSPAPSHDGCTCEDCVYREIVSLLAIRNPRIGELVQVMLTERRLRDDLGI